jgi:hypothetical protein
MKSFLQFFLESDINVIFIDDIVAGYHLPPKSFYDLSSDLYISELNTILSFAYGGHSIIADKIKEGKNICKDKKINEHIKSLYKSEYKDLAYEKLFNQMGLIRFAIPKTYDLQISTEYNKLLDITTIINYICKQVVITTLVLELHNVDGKDIYVNKELENGYHIPDSIEKLIFFIDKYGREGRF